jgi:hypothetical protein
MKYIIIYVTDLNGKLILSLAMNNFIAAHW